MLCSIQNSLVFSGGKIMTLQALQAKTDELQTQGYELVYESEDGYYRYFIDETNNTLFSVSADIAGSAAFARMAIDDPDNRMLPKVHDHYTEGDLHITVMERLQSIIEMTEATDGHYGRMGRNFTNYLAGHDPARGTDNDHQSAYGAFNKVLNLQTVGKAVADLMSEARSNPDAEPILFDRSRQNMMFRSVNDGQSYDFVYMHIFRGVNAHNQSFIDRFNKPADPDQHPVDAPPVRKTREHKP